MTTKFGHFTKAVQDVAEEYGLDLNHHEQRTTAVNLAVRRGRIRPPRYGFDGERVPQHEPTLPLKRGG